MIALKKILVATDFSEPSEAALAYGRELARTFTASLTIVHVVEDVLGRSYGPDAIAMADPGLQAHLAAAGRKQIETLIFDEDRRTIGATGVILTSNATPGAIVSYARDEGFDLIVIGTHGRGAMAHLLMGSVAERVVRTAPCPVLTVRHPEHEFVIADALVAVAKA
jgi:nucleotide-binding universal stress UspA family protein